MTLDDEIEGSEDEKICLKTPAERADTQTRKVDEEKVPARMSVAIIEGAVRTESGQLGRVDVEGGRAS